MLRLPEGLPGETFPSFLTASAPPPGAAPILGARPSFWPGQYPRSSQDQPGPPRPTAIKIIIGTGEARPGVPPRVRWGGGALPPMWGIFARASHSENLPNNALWFCRVPSPIASVTFLFRQKFWNLKLSKTPCSVITGCYKQAHGTRHQQGASAHEIYPKAPKPSKRWTQSGMCFLHARSLPPF